jgi:DNA-binding Lrp family transcriptional regulator
VSPFTRGRIAAFAEAGFSATEIAPMVNLRMQTVWNIIRKARNNGYESRRANCGRKKVFGRRSVNRIHRQVVTNQFKPATDIAREMALEIAPAPSLRTVQRILHDDLHMPARRPARKPALIAAQRQKRLQFCRAHENWTEEQWFSVLWSDESIIEQFGTRQCIVRLPEGQRYCSRYVVKTVKHAESVMIWGCCSASEVGELWFMAPGEKINATFYQIVADCCVQQSMDNLQCTIFQQDGATCHTAASVMKFFDDMEILVMDTGQATQLT